MSHTHSRPNRFLPLLRFLLVLSLLVSIVPTALIAPQPAMAQSEAPTTISFGSAASYDLPSPGLFFHTEPECPPGPGPNAAAANSPDAIDAATPFYIWRTTVRAEDYRLLQNVTDNSAPEDCNPYNIYSNIVADADFVYWVNDSGLVKLSRTANSGDTPELLNAAYAFQLPVELLNDGNRLIAVSNLPVNLGGIIPTGGSYVESVDKVTGDYTVLYRAGTPSIPENKYFRNVKTDGKYVYFVDEDRVLVRLDSSGESPQVRAIGAAVSDYYPEGEVTFCPSISCTTTEYVIYAQDNSIRRYNNLADTDDPIQTLPNGTTIKAMVISRFLFFSTLFFFSEVATPSGPFTSNFTWTLYRTGIAPNSELELLYTYAGNNVSPPDQPANMKTDGTWLFWTEGFDGNKFLKRLPNDVDALPKIDMSITGIEITQGVQNNNNSVRLVKGRETYVRVFVRGDADVPGATMRLYVTYGGSERPALRPINGTHLTAKTAPDRNQLGDSFVFVLPWEASNQDQITLRAELNPFRVPQEPNYANNQFISPPFNFSPGRSIDLIFIEANYCLQRSLLECPAYDVNDTDVHADYMRRAYPIPEGGINYRVWKINGGALLGNHVNQAAKVCQDMRADLRSLCASDWVNAKIGTMRTNAGTGITASTLTYGLITDSSATGGFFPRGQAGTNRIGSGPAGVSITSVNRSDFGYYTGHEIGHMYGRAHPTPNSDDPATTTDSMGNPIIEGCGHSRSDDSFPHALARIGPGDGSIRGFDRAAPSSRGFPEMRVLDDVNAFDMMSYCGNSQLRWPSDYTWEGLYQAIINTPAAAANVAPTQIDGDFLSIFGTIYDEDVFVHSVARLSSVTEQSSGSEGEWRLRLLGEEGNELAAYLFEAGHEEEAANSNYGDPFGVTVPFAAGTLSYEIVEVASGETRYSADVSASAPTVTNVALQSPPNPVTGTVTLGWQGADADGDTLTYDVYYSVNSGTSYQPVVLGVVGTSTPVDTSSLAGGQGRFRIYASDGVNLGEGDSPDYTMAVKGAEVRIIQPVDGARFTWGEMINFSGEALDPQDGLILGPSLTWSTQSVALGSGAQVSSDALQVGANVITLSAQNSAGATTTKQITIYVDDPLELPGPTLALAPSALSFQAQAGATTLMTATVDLENTGGGTLTWSATSDATWLTLDAASGNVPGSLVATANPSGLAANQLHRATITITGSAEGYADQVVSVPVQLSIGNSFINPEGSPPVVEQTSELFMPILVR